MCKTGDIVGVPKFYDEFGEIVGFHYFVVISDKKGIIFGYDFDKVCSLMSSFENKVEEYKAKKMARLENMLVSANEITFDNKKEPCDGYIKADQLHYFDKEKTKYFKVGEADRKLMKKLNYLISYLDEIGETVQNIKNLELID